MITPHPPRFAQHLPLKGKARAKALPQCVTCVNWLPLEGKLSGASLTDEVETNPRRKPHKIVACGTI